MKQEAQLDSTQEPDRAPTGHGTFSDVHELLQQSCLCSWCPGLAAETFCVPGGATLGLLQKAGWRGQVWVLSRQGNPTSRTTASPSPVLAAWVLHGLSWLSALKGTRQEFKELLWSSQMEGASLGIQKCFNSVFPVAWLCPGRTTPIYPQSSHPFPWLCEGGHICRALDLVLLCRSPRSLCQAGAELAAALSYLMAGCGCLCSVGTEGVVLQGGDPFFANAGTKKTLIKSTLAGISKQ